MISSRLDAETRSHCQPILFFSFVCHQFPRTTNLLNLSSELTDSFRRLYHYIILHKYHVKNMSRTKMSTQRMMTEILATCSL